MSFVVIRVYVCACMVFNTVHTVTCSRESISCVLHVSTRGCV